MKRHPAFIPLSREHHDVLLLAQELKKDHPGYARSAVPRTLPEKLAYVQQFYREKILPHFRAEEDILIPRVLGKTPELDSAANDILNDHRRIAGMAAACSDADTLDAFGRELEQHVRREERVFFELVQETLSDDDLMSLVHDLQTASGNHG